MARFITIGERIHCISPTIKKAMEEMNPEPILKRAKEQKKNPYTNEIFVGTKDYKLAMERAAAAHKAA